MLSFRTCVSFPVSATPLSLPDLLLPCTSTFGRLSGSPPRCVSRFRGFCEWPMCPDRCAPPVISARLRLPGFPISVVSAFCFPVRHFAVTASSNFVASFRDSGFACRFFATDLLPSPAASSWLRPSGRAIPAVAAPSFSCSGYFRRPPASAPCCVAPILFSSPPVIRSVAFAHRVFPVSFSRSRRPCSCFFVVFPVMLLLCHRGVLQFFSLLAVLLVVSPRLCRFVGSSGFLPRPVFPTALRR